ncbi:hypothetical protein SAMD00023353_0801420 [Rosellinia necatrix]|uniref:Uncharacterized protein n=1 Tax=Rosellinia necatrix TaxID=77044 RepID=A0A1S8A678_ROSNE|nr:hypothetical protein SAMD00023353_0801420 [Rosellinia necatrix]
MQVKANIFCRTCSDNIEARPDPGLTWEKTGEPVAIVAPVLHHNHITPAHDRSILSKRRATRLEEDPQDPLVRPVNPTDDHFLAAQLAPGPIGSRASTQKSEVIDRPELAPQYYTLQCIPV